MNLIGIACILKYLIEATYSGGGIDAVEVSGQGSSHLTPLPATVTTTSNSEEELILNKLENIKFSFRNIDIISRL